MLVARQSAEGGNPLFQLRRRAGLAPVFVDSIFEQIRAINRVGVTILMVEQNARRALEFSDRGYVLDLGRNALEGKGMDLLTDPRLAELYLG